MCLIVISGRGVYGEWLAQQVNLRQCGDVSELLYSNYQTTLSSPVAMLALQSIWE